MLPRKYGAGILGSGRQGSLCSWLDGEGLTLAGAGSLLQKGREMAKSRIPATDAGRDAPGSLERRGDSKSTRVCKAMFSTSQKIVQLQLSI